VVFEHAFALMRLQATTAVPYLQDDTPTPAPGAYDHSTMGGVRDGVEDEVAQHTLDQYRITPKVSVPPVPSQVQAGV
jgi:hypothetical protein